MTHGSVGSIRILALGDTVLGLLLLLQLHEGEVEVRSGGVEHDCKTKFVVKLKLRRLLNLLLFVPVDVFKCEFTEFSAQSV